MRMIISEYVFMRTQQSFCIVIKRNRKAPVRNYPVKKHRGQLLVHDGSLPSGLPETVHIYTQHHTGTMPPLRPQTITSRLLRPLFFLPLQRPVP